MDRETVRKMIAVAVLAAVSSPGCGYRAGFSMPEGIETIYVSVFINETFYRGLDFDLTQAVKREVAALTDLKIVKEQNADIIMSCSVKDVVENVLLEDENDVPQEVELRMTIAAKAENRAGKSLFESGNLSKSVTYVVVLGEDERLARAKALKEVAEEVVYRMAENLSWIRKEDERGANGGR